MNTRPCTQRQSGYTLVEILVALLIGVFLLGGLFTILQNTRRSSSNQNGLALLQDQERMAMSMLNDVIQSAGYFDAVTYQSATTVWPSAVAIAATGTSLAPGQALTGSDGTTDAISVRYGTNGTSSTTPDNMINCNGATSAAAATFTNTFYIKGTVNGSVTTYALYCSLDGTGAAGTTGVPLVNGVVNMQIMYGVSTVAGSNNVDTYMTATQVASATDWLNVTSVQVTLGFINPYTGSTPYVYFNRVIPIQGRTGVIATAL